MKTKKQAITITLFFLMAGFLACQKEIQRKNQPAEVTVYLTDHQTPVFDSIFIDIRKLEVKLEDDTLSNGGWVELSVRSGIYNILRLRNGIDTLFAIGTLPGIQIRKIRLTLGTQNSVMKDGQSFPLRVKDNDRIVVVDLENSDFDILTSGNVVFWIDFDAGRSIQVDNSGSGNNNGFELRAHIKVFTHRNTGRIEGVVLPPAAQAVIHAISGSDTAIAIPERDGKFKIVGLDAGQYRVLFEGHNGYRDTTIQNVLVRVNEDTRLPTVTLRQ